MLKSSRQSDSVTFSITFGNKNQSLLGCYFAFYRLTKSIFLQLDFPFLMDELFLLCNKLIINPHLRGKMEILKNDTIVSLLENQPKTCKDAPELQLKETIFPVVLKLNSSNLIFPKERTSNESGLIPR